MKADIRTEGSTQIITVGSWNLTASLVDDEPRIRDADLAERLGYERPRKLRELIRRMIREKEFSEVVMRPIVGRGRNQHGETSATVRTDEFWLTEEQALLAAARSETAKAMEIRRDLVRVFVAARRGLLVPRVTFELESKIVALTAKVNALEGDLGGVIGAKLARTYILNPIQEAARHLCLATGDPSKKRYRSALKDLDGQVRMHVQFPASLAQSWANLPIVRLGDAQAKVAELKARAMRQSEQIRRLAQTEIFGRVAGTPPLPGLAN